VEMLVTVDCQCAPLDQTGADSVRPLAFLIPDGTSPQTPGMKRLVIDGRAAPFDRHTVTISEQDTASDAAYRQIETVETRLGNPDEWFEMLPGLPQFRLCQIMWGATVGRIEPMQIGRPAPGGNQRGLRCSVRGDRGLDAVSMMTV
jgi:hypothetical protein